MPLFFTYFLPSTPAVDAGMREFWAHIWTELAHVPCYADSAPMAQPFPLNVCVSCTAGMGGHRGAAAEADVAYVRAALAAHGGAAVPDNFELTAPGPSEQGAPGRMPQAAQRSPQTLAFLELLGLPYNLDLAPAAQRNGGAAFAHGRAPGLGQPAGQGCAVAGAISGQSCSGAGDCMSAP